VNLCASLTAPDAKITCLQLTGSETYDANGVAVCATLSTDDRKTTCMQIIGGMVFDKGKLAVCKTESEDNRVTCMQQIGEVPAPPPPTSVRRGYWVANIPSAQEAWQDVVNSALSQCSGWAHYTFEDANWQQVDCWSSDEAYADNLSGPPARYTDDRPVGYGAYNQCFAYFVCSN
jgi:hypothetical protein